MYTWVYYLYLMYHLASFVCSLLEKMYTWVYIYFIYHNYMIHHRLSVFCLKKGVYMSIYFIYRITFIIVCCLKKGCLHEYIIYISYIIYNRMFVCCLKKKKEKMYTWVYHSYIIYYLSSFVCPLLKKNLPEYIIYISYFYDSSSFVSLLPEKKGVYMSISFMYRISVIIVCAWKKGCIREYILYI